jgi:hypothetical protein
MPERARAVPLFTRSFLQVAGPEALGLLGDALGAVPDTAAPAADRQCFMAAVAAAAAESAPSEGADAALHAALGELSEVCRRSRRAEVAVLRALLPLELQAEVIRT